jgi:hypothetical protein
MSEDQIKQILGHLDYPYDKESWGALSSKLDSLTDPPAVQQVDLAVYTTLKQLKTAPYPALWSKLSQSLEYIQARERTIKWMKAIEYVLIAALLWGLSPKDQADIRPTAPNSAKPNSPETMASGAAFPSESYPSLPVDHAPVISSLYPSIRPVAAASLVLPAGEAPSGEAPLYTEQRGQTTSQQIEVLKTDPLDMPELPHNVLIACNTETPPPAPMPPYTPKTMFWSLGFNGDGGYFPNGLAADRYGAVGLSAFAGFRRATWQYQAGVNVGRYALNTLPVEEFYAGDFQSGYVGQRLLGSRATVLSFPVQVHRQLLVVGNIRAVALAGFTAHATMTRSVDYEAILVTPPQGSGPIVLPAYGKPQRLTTEKGLLQGGTLTDNIWSSAQLGLQLEYPLGLKQRIFLQQACSRDLGVAQLSPLPRRRTFYTVTAGIQFGF